MAPLNQIPGSREWEGSEVGVKTKVIESRPSAEVKGKIAHSELNENMEVARPSAKSSAGVQQT
jgi:hypothetical protein